MHVSRRYQGLVTEKIHTTPELPDVTPIADATVNSGPDAETFPQELTNYTEEVSSQRILPMVYISGNNPRSQQTRMNQDEESNKNLQISLNHRVEHEQMDKHGPLSQRYMEPSVQGGYNSKLADVTGVLE